MAVISGMLHVSAFPNIPSSPEDFADCFYLSRGCDYGHDIVWVDGEVLYLVGTTGGYNFDFQCPFPGTSYCETTFAPLLDGADDFDGMIARFDLRDVHIGITESALPSHILRAYPSPASDHIMIDGPAWVNSGCELDVVDAIGRVVLHVQNHRGNPVSVKELADGSYSLILRAPLHGYSATARFIKL